MSMHGDMLVLGTQQALVRICFASCLVDEPSAMDLFYLTAIYTHHGCGSPELMEVLGDFVSSPV